MADLRFSLRILARSPLVSLVVVLSLGLGIGANTAIFSLLHQIVLRALPVEQPEQLVLLNFPGEFKNGRSSSNDAGGPDYIFSYPMFRRLEKNPRGVTGVAAFRLLPANISYHKQTVDGSVAIVSGSYFPVLGVKPEMGRLLSPEDDVHGAGREVVVLSHGYWRSRLGGQRDVLNQPIRVNGHLFTIVGIAPKGFTGTTLGDEPALFVPLCFKPLMTPGSDGTDRWNDYWLYLLARSKPGSTRQQAEAALNGPYHAAVEEQVAVAGSSFRLPTDRERFRRSNLKLLDGNYGQSAMRDQGRVPLLILMASTCIRAADRDCQHGQPAAGACGTEGTGIDDPLGVRGWPRQHHGPDACRIRHPLGDGRPGGSRVCVVDSEGAALQYFWRGSV